MTFRLTSYQYGEGKDWNVYKKLKAVSRQRIIPKS